MKTSQDQAAATLLVAPCGMNCALCSSYLAYAHRIPKKRGKISHCPGCRPRKKMCAFLKKRCVRLAQGKVEYCFECPGYPCDRLKHVDNRYQDRYGMSLIENLEVIRTRGIQALSRLHKKRYRCGQCGTLKSIHSGKCFQCDPIRSWKD